MMLSSSSIRVSILIPCYNASLFIEEAIQSALDQTYPLKEVIVIDDGSKDNSLEIIKKFDGKIKWISRHNMGGNFTRNQLLELSNGDWIQYLDADDFLNKQKLEENISFIEMLGEGNVDCTYGPIEVFETISGLPKKYILPIKYPADPLLSLICWDLPQTNSMLFKKSKLAEIGGWKNDQKVCQEHELYLRLLKANAKFVANDFVGSSYRIYSNETVCRVNPLMTYKTRISIMKEASDFMHECNLLEGRNMKIVGNVFWQMCRDLWHIDKGFSCELSRYVENKYGSPSFGLEMSNSYVLLARFLGFSFTERIADYLR